MNTENYSNDGFFIFKDPEVVNFKESICQRLKQTAFLVCKKIRPDILKKYDVIQAYSNGDLIQFLSIIHLYEDANEVSRACYEVFPTLPDVLSVVNSDLMLRIVKLAGLLEPQAGTVPLVRLDRPNEDMRLTPWHQDYWFSFLSKNSIVIWVPLGIFTSFMGFLKVIRGSHKMGCLPFQINRDSAEPFVLVENFDDYNNIEEITVALDEILVFNQMLVHKSGINRSDKIRISMQLRFNDLYTADEMTSSFTSSHSRHTKNEQNKHIVHR